MLHYYLRCYTREVRSGSCCCFFRAQFRQYISFSLIWSGHGSWPDRGRKRGKNKTNFGAFLQAAVSGISTTTTTGNIPPVLRKHQETKSNGNFSARAVGWDENTISNVNYFVYSKFENWLFCFPNLLGSPQLRCYTINNCTCAHAGLRQQTSLRAEWGTGSLLGKVLPVRAWLEEGHIANIVRTFTVCYGCRVGGVKVGIFIAYSKGNLDFSVLQVG